MRYAVIIVELEPIAGPFEMMKPNWVAQDMALFGPKLCRFGSASADFGCNS